MISIMQQFLLSHEHLQQTNEECLLLGFQIKVATYQYPGASGYVACKLSLYDSEKQLASSVTLDFTQRVT